MKHFSQTFREWLRKNPLAWYALLFPAYMASYFATEAIVGENADYWVSYLPLDDKIPFLEWFAPIYYIWAFCLLFVGLYLLFKDGAGFKKFMIFLFGGMFASLLICLLFPNGQNLRPTVFPRENFFTEMVRMIYSVDTCTNVFPACTSSVPSPRSEPFFTIGPAALLAAGRHPVHPDLRLHGLSQTALHSGCLRRHCACRSALAARLPEEKRPLRRRQTPPSKTGEHGISRA
jgi:hypothetical protein